MKKYDFIGIEEANIYGIKNPCLIVSGTVLRNDAVFELYVDDKKVEFEIFENDDHFTIKKQLKPTDKDIKLYVGGRSKNHLIISRKNKLFSRIKLKITKTLKAILSKIKIFVYVIYRGIRAAWIQYHFLIPPKLWKKYYKEFIFKLKNSGRSMFYNPFRQEDYLKWLESNEKEEEIKKLKYNPLISIVIPVYNIGREYLTQCLDSILNQTYSNFEICLADDCSTNEETIKTLKEYEKKDKRIKVVYRKENGHISKATNSALDIATGEFIGLVDNDDVLTPNALYEVAKVLNEDKKLDFIYSDEDKLDLKGNRCDPHFKPDFSPDTLLSLNYICHFSVIRKSIIDKVGGFEVGLEGAQDHDLFLKVSEKTDRIYHIPKILYHWRMVKGSTSMTIDNKSYATDKGKIAIENALKRRKIKGHVEKDPVSTYYRVVYDYDKEPMVSIIIPTRDYADITETCLKSIYEKTDYKNFEILLVNNNSEKEETFKLFDKYKKKYKNFKVIDANMEFNYSKINNLAVKKAKGEYIMLLNNDTEIISKDWLKVMVGYAMQPHIGAVGPKLLYPDNTVQHAGVILGLGGVASHAYIGSQRNDLGMYGRLRVPYDYSAVTAACLMVSKKKFDEVNGLEEDLKVAYNDMDFNIKLLKKGYYNICVPQIELHHYESKSRGLDTTSEKYKRFLLEEKYMYDKWDYELQHDKFYNPNFTKRMWFVLDKDKENK